MAEATIGHKREMMEITHRLIPLMEQEEIGELALVCNKVIERLISEGRVTKEDLCKQ